MPAVRGLLAETVGRRFSWWFTTPKYTVIEKYRLGKFHRREYADE